MSHCAAEYQGLTALSAQREWKIRSQRNAKAARIWNITSVDPENVKQFLVSKYAAQINAMGLNGGEISDDFDFFLRGVIDSLGILEMISSVEDEFNVRRPGGAGRGTTYYPGPLFAVRGRDGTARVKAGLSSH